MTWFLQPCYFPHKVWLNEKFWPLQLCSDRAFWAPRAACRLLLLPGHIFCNIWSLSPLRNSSKNRRRGRMEGVEEWSNGAEDAGGEVHSPDRAVCVRRRRERLAMASAALRRGARARACVCACVCKSGSCRRRPVKRCRSAVGGSAHLWTQQRSFTQP